MSDLCIRLDLKGESASRFAKIKVMLGFKTNTSVLIHLINDAYSSLNSDLLNEEIKEAV